MVIYLVDDTELFHAPFEEEIGKQLAAMQLHAEIYSFSDTASFLCQVQALPPDICFLDIVLEKDCCDGLELAGQLRELAPHCRIIFLTNYLQYVTSSFDVRPTYYILKSEFRERLPAALKLAVQSLPPKPAPTISLVIRRRRLTIPANSVFYFERVQRETKVVCEDQTLITRESLSSLADRMGESFSHCHSSFLVNLNHVKSMSRKAFHLDNGLTIPISRTLFADAQSRFARFLAERALGGEE